MARYDSSSFWRAALMYCPKGFLGKIFTQSMRLVYEWAADKNAEYRAKNPLDRVRDVMEGLQIAGQGCHAQNAIDYLSEPLGGEFTGKKRAISDKGTVDGEIADISIAIGDLATEIRAACNDGNIDPDERMKIVCAARKVQNETNQLLDAAGINEDDK
ncbi:hypothetical protein LCGC14_1851840 [marine sediment metagenome]|uniref:Uncharacterized protein n=1 Tax=marine sediment metagenome TaxID=412755 RepID=A0A0F9J9C9_9ZZZZ